MKTVTTTISVAYTCDGCATTATSTSGIPVNWKSWQIQKLPPASKPVSVDLCPTCSAAGNASGIAGLAKLLN